MRTAERVKRRVKTDDDRRLVLYWVTWEGYEKFLDAAEGTTIRINYDRGTLEMIVPSFDHEAWRRSIDRLILALCVVLGVDFRGAGSTTLRRKDLARGLEPDESYYIQNIDAVRNIHDLDLTIIPPPDLVLEVERSRGTSVERMELYAALRVPEVWRFDGSETVMCHLREGDYEIVTESVAFPGLTVERVTAFLAVAMPMDEEVALFRFASQWVKKNILPLRRKKHGRKS